MDERRVTIQNELARLDNITPGQKTELNQAWEFFFFPRTSMKDNFPMVRAKRAAHSIDVALLLMAIPVDQTQTKSQAESLAILGLFHDVGKVHSDLIKYLSLDQPITQEQKEALMGHPNYAAVVLHSLGLHLYGEVVGSHHEKFDGSGYPEQLTGEYIPLLAGLVSIADRIAAATSNYASNNLALEVIKKLREELGKTINNRLVVALDIISVRLESETTLIPAIYALSKEIVEGWERGDFNQENTNIIEQVVAEARKLYPWS